MPNKPKNNSKGNPKRDRCQTPDYALNPLIQHLKAFEWKLGRKMTIWESAAGDGLLADALEIHGFKVVRSDILTGQSYFEYQPPEYDIEVTNVPFSIKYLWLKQAYAYKKPFCFLMPSDTQFAKTAQQLFKTHGINILVPDARIDFKMPDKGWDGRGAQFSTSWFLWQVAPHLETVTFVELNKPRKVRKPRPRKLTTGQLALFDIAV